MIKNSFQLKIGIVLAVILFLAAFGISQANFNEQINFQGKLTDNSNLTVADGDYNMEFKLYATSSGGVALWTETATTTKISVTSGLFSHLLGSISSLSDVDFNQTLWLGVTIGGSEVTPDWDSEMTPRKKLGAVPAAFEAKKLGGKLESAFATLAEDETITGAWTFNNILTISTSTASTTLTVTQSGAGNIIDLRNATGSVFNIANDGTVTAAGNMIIGGTATTTNLIVTTDSKLGTISGGTWEGTPIGILYGGTGTTTAAGARTNLGLGNVENVALSTWLGSANITTLGTIATGTWQGTKIDISDFTSLTATGGIVLTGDELSHSTADGYKHIPSVGSSAQILQYSAAGTAKWITVSSDITIADNGAVTIANNAVSDAKLRDSAGYSIIGKATTGTGDPADIVAAADGVLRRSGAGDLAFGTIVAGNIASDAVTTAKIPDANVTLAKIQNIATLSVIGRSTTDTGVPEVLSAASDYQVLRRSGTTLGFGTISIIDSTTGTLTVARGGTGTTTFTAGRVLFGADTSAINTDSNLHWDNANKRLGIGTTTPAYKLDVASVGGGVVARFGATGTDEIIVGGGAGKIWAATIDPPYTIVGQGLYSTYAPSMTGIQEETTGIIKLSHLDEYDDYYSYIIDFNDLEKDSNLWLFYRVTDFGENWQNLAVLLSAEGQGQVWYEKNPIQNQLIIYGESPSFVSFRLTSARFDWKKHLNVRENGEIVGLLIEDFVNDQYTETREDEEELFDTAQAKSLFDKFVLRVKEALASLGMFVEDGIASLREIIADKITTRKLCLEDVCVTKTELQSLLDGTKTNQSVSQTISGSGEEAPINGQDELAAEEDPAIEEPPAEEQTTEEPVVEEEQIVEELEIEEPAEESGQESISEEEISGEIY